MSTADIAAGDCCADLACSGGSGQGQTWCYSLRKTQWYPSHYSNCSTNHVSSCHRPTQIPRALSGSCPVSSPSEFEISLGRREPTRHASDREISPDPPRPRLGDLEADPTGGTDAPGLAYAHLFPGATLDIWRPGSHDIITINNFDVPLTRGTTRTLVCEMSSVILHEARFVKDDEKFFQALFSKRLLGCSDS